jgi:hypothetical protein
MSELLFGTFGPDIVAYARHYPWKVFAAVLCGGLLLFTILRPNASQGAGGDFDFGSDD